MSQLLDLLLGLRVPEVPAAPYEPPCIATWAQQCAAVDDTGDFADKAARDSAFISFMKSA